MLDSKRAINVKNSSGIFISGDYGTVSFGSVDKPKTLQIPFKPNSVTNSVTSLLRWQSRLTPLFGREDELKTLHDWLDSDLRIAYGIITGEGGVGKTRLAFEFAEEARARGWAAGQLDYDENDAAYATGDKGLLFIIDYPEERHSQIQTLLRAIYDSEEPESPLRIVFLSRKTTNIQTLFDQTASEFSLQLPLSALDEKRKNWEFFDSACKGMLQKRSEVAKMPGLDREDFFQWLQQSEHNQTPLFILAYAFNLIEDESNRHLTGAEVINELVKRELIRIRKEASAFHYTEQSLEVLIALSAITQGFSKVQMAAFADETGLSYFDLESPEKLSYWQAAETSDHGTIKPGKVKPMEPDLLAASLLANVLSQNEAAGKLLYSALVSAAQIDHATSMLGRLAYDAGQILASPLPLGSLEAFCVQEPERCRKLDLGLCRNDIETNLLNLSIAVSKTLLTEGGEEAEQARILNNLSIQLSAVGRDDDALAAIERSVELYEPLVQTNAAAYTPDLARSLNSLSIRLSAVGRDDDALTASERSVELYEPLVQTNAAAYTPDLARSLNNLSIRLSAVGRDDDALTASERSVELYEPLVQTNAAAYTPDLARSLNTLSNQLSAVGRDDDALTASERSVELYEPLVQTNAAAYTPDLARSLNTLSNQLSAVGRDDDALTASERSVELYEPLVQTNAAAYTPDLARSLNTLSNQLSAVGRDDDALTASERSVELYEPLVQTNAAAYTPDLALSLNNLSIQLSAVGRDDDALTASERSVELYEPLVQTNAAAYTPYLARSLSNKSDRLEALEQYEKAYRLSRRAFTLIEQFAKPGTQWQGLRDQIQLDLNRLSKQLKDGCEND